MIVKMNGQALAPRMVQQEAIDEQVVFEDKLQRLGEQGVIIATGIGILNMGSTAFAKSGDLGDKLMPLVHMAQDFALPLGILVSIWGLIEVIIGNPGGKLKIKMAVIGYCGIFLIPEVFYAIREAFRA